MAVTFAVESMADVEHVDTDTDTDLAAIGEETGNDIIRGIVAGEKIGRVTSARHAVRGEVRGWTLGGRVD